MRGAAWLERLSILLELVSFFLATPEILGEKRLKAIEGWLVQKVESGAPVVIGYICTFLGMVVAAGILDVVSAVFRISTTTPLPVLGGIAVAILFLSGLLFGGTLGDLVSRRMLIPRLHRLVEDPQGRRRWLVLGAALFFIARVLQFFATLMR
jgi:MFS family permease